mgnify:CR=1 FL=1
MSNVHYVGYLLLRVVIPAPSPFIVPVADWLGNGWSRAHLFCFSFPKLCVFFVWGRGEAQEIAQPVVNISEHPGFEPHDGTVANMLLNCEKYN